MATVQALLYEAAGLPTEDPRRDAEILLCHCLQRPRSWLYAWPEGEVDETAVAAYRRLLQERGDGVPIAYLTQRREFWSLPLRVTPATLIPRPDTEALVHWALELPLPAAACVLDLGTGSGAIALALASERPAWRVLAVDADRAALAVADSNVAALAPGRVTLLHSDWFTALPPQRFDLVVANPPYVAAGDRHLGEGDVRFEPRQALVSGERGLDDLTRIIAGAPPHLASAGFLLLEHGWDQAAAVRQRLSAQGFGNVTTRRDLGGNERVSAGQWHAVG
ncbi:peptide chain release factor N(5)-glutamine methyltransferase [Chromatocurvus halotolerans]|uniref:Release factor glutamine methyltransferase n=1 Tax=Chromatocurvus halotolerans TaxID=1132028 RepID=A0A4R2KY02_9GAMM|nr:peptide chain release factor N(5)-glutamine methyltransferase [Chromatocurvus halotolerans]TCO76249.1 [protein release factor]-glutamine N5-methyltransferase [Chromatocurvus halotolerans]